MDWARPPRRTRPPSASGWASRLPRAWGSHGVPAWLGLLFRSERATPARRQPEAGPQGAERTTSRPHASTTPTR